MFNVIDKTTGEIHIVYGMNGTHFLIYNAELDCWYYKDMSECRPCIAGVDLGVEVLVDPEAFRGFNYGAK